MKTKHYILILLVLALSISAVSAHENHTNEMVLDAADQDKLEKTTFYDADTGRTYDDDTVVTHNVVKYYGDTDTRFKVKVYDDDYTPLEDVEVSFGKYLENYKRKTTNHNGIVYFNINYKVGTHYVETIIDSDDGESYWSADNIVKVKSTIKPKGLVKYSSSKKKFQIKFLDTKGKGLDGKLVKLKIKGKTYKLKTDSKGIVKIKSTRFKLGKQKITAYNPITKETRKLNVVVLKKGVQKMNIRIDDPTVYFPIKKLKNGDYINTVYETKHIQYNPGVYVQCSSGGLENPKHTKLLKAKFYFKNKKTGKIITKTSKKVKYNEIVVKPIKGYSPYKAVVWYKDKK